ncbi:flagellar export protein FliJ [Aliamphritea spongicola]|uniref:flagellar export protein FliJ n=1 Tax=Aliamphritea spongicola TaxID=707589 RepID=UPI00196B14B4|nr:flagellar export protein FliJ [Aliamphritea spongicola]MBN3563518.1 flagellar export protein FliJ [Aliamphritea spongicola]
MKRSKRLEIVLEQAERKRKQADQLLADSQGRVQKGLETMQQLEQYYAEYANNFYANGAGGVNVQQLDTHQAFMQKIRAAIEQQRLAIESDQQHLEKVREHWKAAYGHFKAIDSVIDKAREDERRVDEKKQQQQIDERSQLVRTPFI